jgi:hypothetical protein
LIKFRQFLTEFWDIPFHLSLFYFTVTPPSQL